MPVNNALNNGLITTTGLTTLKNARYGVVQNRSSTVGNVDLYTVPAGKKVFVQSMYSGNGMNLTWQIKISGVYYPLTAGSPVGLQQNTQFCLFLAGETIARNYLGGIANPNLFVSYVEFDDDTPITRATLTSFIAGDNTLYTCPANTQAIPVNLYSCFAYYPGSVAFGSGVNTNSLLNYFNTSGGTRTLTFYYVPSGGSPSSTNATWSGTISNNTNPAEINNTYSFPALNAGDSCVINTDSAASGQIAWLNVWEKPI